jgi:hypothetical protein
MGHFLKDLEESKVAVNVVKTFLESLHSKDSNAVITELGKARQKEGDVEVVSDCGITYSVEVKYDMMAKKTGNLCFETHNSKGVLTGISSTEADEIHYVVPGDDGFFLYMFKTEDLRNYLFDTGNIKKFKSVKGGDRRATCMLLVNRTILEEDKVAYKIEKIDA